MRSWFGATFVGCLVGCASAPPAEAPAAVATTPRASASGRGGRAELDRARSLAQKEETEEAIGAAQKAIELDPNLEDAYLLLASLCDLAERGACVHETLERGLMALPRSAELWHVKGMMQLEDTDPSAAVKTLKEAHELAGKKDAEIAADLAYALIFVESLAEAEEVARLARSLAPRAFAPAYTHGEALLRLGRGEAAVDALEAALGAEGADARVARRRLGDARLMSGDPQRALEDYRASIEGDGTADLHVSIAAALMRLGRPTEAVDEMKKAATIAPSDARVKALLLEAEKAAKNQKKGKGKK
ncbi:MAG: tetratricopeptide repeat protein [Deltaproteobacteria bacterium]|nr:tetratricopeptide repeat protein [Deltaproteobacteria bacterium]